MMCVISVCDNYDRMTVGEWMSCSWGKKCFPLFIIIIISFKDLSEYTPEEEINFFLSLPLLLLAGVLIEHLRCYCVTSK